MPVTMHDPEQRREKVSGLIERYRAGEFSEAVFTASLKARGVQSDDVSWFLFVNRPAHQSSLPYKRGTVS